MVGLRRGEGGRVVEDLLRTIPGTSMDIPRFSSYTSPSTCSPGETSPPMITSLRDEGSEGEKQDVGEAKVDG